MGRLPYRYKHYKCSLPLSNVYNTYNIQGKLKSLYVGVEYNIIKKSGSWFSYGETKLGQGRDAVKGLLADNPDLTEELETKIYEVLA